MSLTNIQSLRNITQANQKKKNTVLRRKFQATSFHFPHIPPCQNQPFARDKSIEEIARLMKKIYRYNSNSSYIPNKQEHQKFTINKTEELRKKYYKARKVGQKTQKTKLELDPIVMDCWSYLDNDNTGVWTRYKEKVSDLSYHTLKVLNKKRENRNL